jgi:DNA-binding transcriptional regulator PaaX
MKTEYELALEMFFWGLETFSRKDCGLILAGYRDTSAGRRIDQLLNRLQHERLLARHGRGPTAQFSITVAGRQRVTRVNPSTGWNRTWDGRWRVFSFDLPATRRSDRQTLWRALRDHKLGLLQRSVWIWPHEVEQLLRQVVDARNIPECFCGFEASRLFLCDTTEVVATAWDWEEISKRHTAYLRHLVATPSAVQKTSDLRKLARLARVERDAHRYAFSLDPLLPRSLWPAHYHGLAVETQHEQFCSALQQRLRAMIV